MRISNERHNLTGGEGWFKCSSLGIAALGFRIAVINFFPERTEFDFSCNEENNCKKHLFAVEAECANFL